MKKIINKLSKTRNTFLEEFGTSSYYRISQDIFQVLTLTIYSIKDDPKFLAYIYKKQKNISTFKTFILNKIYKFNTQTNCVSDETLKELYDYQNFDFILKISSKLFKLLKNEDIEIFAYFYEKCLYKTQNNIIKENGIFYTPESVIDEILNNSLMLKLKSVTTIKELLNIKILDPAMGCGLFLIKAYKLLLQHASKICIDVNKYKKQILTSSLYGIDKDIKAVKITKIIFYLITKCKVQDLNNNFIIGNSLLRYDELSKEISLKLLAINFKKLKINSFDIIIGNPPYGLSRDHQLEEQENTILQKQYKKFFSGKFNKYMAFIQRSYELLMPNGILSFIVPNSWLGIRSSRILRKELIKNHNLTKIIIYNSHIFKKANVETVVFRIEKKLSNTLLIEKKEQPLTPPLSSVEFNYDTLLLLQDFIIPLNWTASYISLYKQLKSKSIPLYKRQDLFTPKITIQAYAKGKGIPPQTELDVKNHIYHSNVKKNENFIKYLEPSDISRYNISWSGLYLHYGNHLAEPQNLQRFSCPRILIREITGKFPYVFLCVVTTETYLYNKSVLHIINTENPNLNAMKALATILNSALGGVVLNLQGRKFQRHLFPKIVIDDLDNFPLPIDFDAYIQQLAYLYDKLKSNLISQQEVDKIIFNIYSLESSYHKLLNNIS